MTVTVLGGSGFIGSHLIDRLRKEGTAHSAPDRGADLRGRNLGVVVYCAGVTADFRTRPFDTVAAHVTGLAELLTFADVETLVYLSSARLYRRSLSPAAEDALVPLASVDPDDLYDISKLMGEAVALAGTCPAYVLRLSNVYGTDVASPNFLSSVIREALGAGQIVFRTALESWKDYVHIDDVVDMVLRIAHGGTRVIYNVASGVNVSHLQLAETLAQLTGCRYTSVSDSSLLQPPQISVDRVRNEFHFRPASLLDDLPSLVASYRKALDG